MMEAKDWISFLVGAVVTCLGLLPLLHAKGIGAPWFALNNLPVSLFAYIVAIMGLYLLVESFIEITNSNPIGWFSVLIAMAVIAIGILPILFNAGKCPNWCDFTWLTDTVYRIVFIVEGIFLMIACFAMEL